MAGTSGGRVKVFLSYAHTDRKLRDELDEHMGALKRERIIEVWWDGQIPPGSEWKEEIARRLEQADIIVLLVSSAFLDSTYCYDKEMRRAVERHQADTARVVWIHLRPCHWEPAPFAKLQGLPKGLKAVASGRTRGQRDTVWAEIAEDIHRVVEACAARLANAAPSPNTAMRQSKEPPPSAELQPSPPDAVDPSPRRDTLTKSSLPPRFRSFNMFDKSIEIGTTDAQLTAIGSPVPLNEIRNGSSRVETNTYIRLSFIKDDGNSFPIKLRNMLPPGAEGDRFTVLWALINGTTEFLHSFVNHSTREWANLQPKKELFKELWLGSPSRASRLVLGGIIAAAVVAWGAIAFFESAPVLLGLAVVAGLAIAVQWIRTVRLWRFLRDAQAAVEIS